MQIGAVVAPARLRGLALGEGEGHVEEERYIGARQAVVTEFEVENPLCESVARLPGGKFRTLEAYVRVDIAVEDHGFARGDPRPDLRSRRGAVACEEQGHEIGIDLVHAAELPPEKTGDQLAVDRSVEARKMHILALHAPFREELSQHADLGRFARPVQAFEYDEHR